MLYQQQALDPASTFEDNVLHAANIPDGAVLAYIDEDGNEVPLVGADLPSMAAPGSPGLFATLTDAPTANPLLAAALAGLSNDTLTQKQRIDAVLAALTPLQADPTTKSYVDGLVATITNIDAGQASAIQQLQTLLASDDNLVKQLLATQATHTQQIGANSGAIQQNATAIAGLGREVIRYDKETSITLTNAASALYHSSGAAYVVLNNSSATPPVLNLYANGQPLAGDTFAIYSVPGNAPFTLLAKTLTGFNAPSGTGPTIRAGERWVFVVEIPTSGYAYYSVASAPPRLLTVNGTAPDATGNVAIVVDTLTNTGTNAGTLTALLANKIGQNGLLIQNKLYGLADLILQASGGTLFTMRYETRPAYLFSSANTSGELQFFNATNPTAGGQKVPAFFWSGESASSITSPGGPANTAGAGIDITNGVISTKAALLATAAEFYGTYGNPLNGAGGFQCPDGDNWYWVPLAVQTDAGSQWNSANNCCDVKIAGLYIVEVYAAPGNASGNAVGHDFYGGFSVDQKTNQGTGGWLTVYGSTRTPTNICRTAHLQVGQQVGCVTRQLDVQHQVIYNMKLTLLRAD